MLATCLLFSVTRKKFFFTGKISMAKKEFPIDLEKYIFFFTRPLNRVAKLFSFSAQKHKKDVRALNSGSLGCVNVRQKRRFQNLWTEQPWTPLKHGWNEIIVLKLYLAIYSANWRYEDDHIFMLQGWALKRLLKIGSSNSQIKDIRTRYRKELKL